MVYSAGGVLLTSTDDNGDSNPLLQAIWSLVRARSASLAIIADINLFPADVGLCQNFPLSPILFVIFMGRISRLSQEVGSFYFIGFRISTLLFADDVASLGGVLQLTLQWFTAKCEVAGMTISTSESDAMVFRKDIPDPPHKVSRGLFML